MKAILSALAGALFLSFGIAAHAAPKIVQIQTPEIDQSSPPQSTIKIPGNPKWLQELYRRQGPTLQIAPKADRPIVPGERIGPLRLDAKIGEIVKLFGPGTLRPGGWSFSKLQTWDVMGVWVDFDPGTGNVLWIGIAASGSYPWAEYSTPEDIRIGARREDVVAAMGAPERTVSDGGLTSLYYDSRGLRLTLSDIGPRAGTVGEIRVVWPSVLRGDTLIVPGRRISTLEVGMPIDRALTQLGSGYHRGERPGFHVYYWPHLALSVVETGGYVNSVRAARDKPADALGIRYATAEGLGEGSALADVKRIYGELRRTQLSKEGLNSWIYDSHGIAFAFDHVQKIRFIDVFRSGGAIADFDRIIALDPNDAYAYYDRGSALMQKGELDRAIADLGKTIELDPKYAPAYFGRGGAFEKKGNLDRAIADYDRAIDLDTKNGGAYTARGAAYGRKGDFDRAIADASKAIELDWKDSTAYNNRAMAHLGAGKAAQALPDAEKSLDLSPNDPYALDTRGQIFEALGRKDEAIADFRRALAKEPNLQSSKDALNRMGVDVPLHSPRSHIGEDIGLILMILAYVSPSFIAFYRKHPNRMLIAAISIAFGWTVFVWLIALGWALWSYGRSPK